MDTFFVIPAILRIILVFLIILFLINKKISLGKSFILGSLAMGFMFGMSPSEIGSSSFKSVISPNSLSLAAIVSLILILSRSMDYTGQMGRLLQSFKGVVKNPGFNLAVFPALIGLLPMPGGAVFSAPMVKEIADGGEIEDNQLSFINYWFRHIWEYFWPLYPGVLLATSLAGIGLAKFVIAMLPFTIIAIFVGYIPLKNTNLAISNDIQTSGGNNFGLILPELFPILLVVLAGPFTGLIISMLNPDYPVAMETGLITSLILSITVVWTFNSLGANQVKNILSDKHILSMIFMVLAILIFKGVLEDSRAVNNITDELIAYEVPLVMIVVILPFTVGLITGITIAFVGVSMPVLIPLIAAYGEMNYMLSYAVLIMVSGFTGVLLSPLHLCLILSNQYFQTEMGEVYKYLWKLCLLMTIAGISYFAFLHWGIGKSLF